MTPRTLPPTASVAIPDESGKLVAPAATRNADDILAVLNQFAPKQGQALEIASGTGQHIVHFAQAMPSLNWQPTDIDPTRIGSIAAYVAQAGLDNLQPPAVLDASQTGWSAAHPFQDLIFTVNLLHLISADEAATVISESVRALNTGGIFALYGPFMRGGELTSEGDKSFHASLIAADPAIGYKDDFDTLDLMVAAGCEIMAVIEMPANNLMLIGKRW